MNTADSTRAIPISAPVISSMDFTVACFGVRFGSSCKIRSTFSTTTIASSTNKPIASTKPNMVKVLIENPQTCMIAKVPNNTTGTVIEGIKVARKFCKNKYMMNTTKMIASIMVWNTSLIETSMNLVVS